MDQAKLVEDSLWKTWSEVVYPSDMVWYVLLGPFLKMDSRGRMTWHFLNALELFSS